MRTGLKYIIVFQVFLCFHLFSQTEADKWYFGYYAGLDFSGNSPAALTGALNTSEGCSSVSDASGNLLFYTDGITIYNKWNLTMANGFGLLGYASSTQSGLIVKKPGSSTIYFVFTQGAVVDGLRYSIVDMSLSAGQGSVTVKNVLMQSPSSEKLTAVRHCNGVDTWIMTHDNGSANFRAYLVTSAGVSSAAVVSGTGVSYAGFDYAGNLKFSPTGKRLAVAIYGNSAAFEIYDFDNSTGAVSNPVVLGNNFTNAYGIEFSADGTKLYGTLYSNTLIYQWDLCSGSPQAIIASQYTVAASGALKGALQLGPDGKIYVARNGMQSLGVINNPNLAGSACNYSETGQSIAPNLSTWGLPNFITSSLKPSPVFTFTVSNLLGCQTASFNSPFILQSSSVQGCSSSAYSFTGTTWDFGDPASGAANTSTLGDPLHRFTSLGTYTTQLMLHSNCGGTDTIRQVIEVDQSCITISSSSVTCASPGSATVSSIYGVGPFSYTWTPTSQTTAVAAGLLPGTYTVIVQDLGNNLTYSSTILLIAPPSYTAAPININVTASSPTACAGASISLTAFASGGTRESSAGYGYTWTPGPYTNTLVVNELESGNYIYTVTSGDGISCTATATISVSFLSPAGYITGSNERNCVPFCSDFKFSNSEPGAIIFSSWEIGDVLYTGEILHQCFNDTGDYNIKVTVTNEQGCKGSVSALVQAHPLPEAGFEYFPRKLVDNEAALFTSTSTGKKLTSWSWYFSDSTFYVSDDAHASQAFKSAGAYPVALVVRNVWGCADTAIKIVEVGQSFSMYVPDVFTPNGDDINEGFCALGLGIKAFHLSVFNRWGEKVFETNDPAHSWDGNFKGKPCKSDIYAWKISATSVMGQFKQLMGSVFLYR